MLTRRDFFIKTSSLIIPTFVASIYPIRLISDRFKLFHSKFGAGNVSTVEFDPENQQIKKSFLINGNCLNGYKPVACYNNQKQMNDFFTNEVTTLTKLNSINADISPKLISFDKDERSLIQSYEGKTLLDLIYNENKRWVPEKYHLEQIVNIYVTLRKNNISRPSCGLSNWCLGEDDKIRAIDFKWSYPAKSYLTKSEIRGIKELKILSPALPKMILKALNHKMV